MGKNETPVVTACLTESVACDYNRGGREGKLKHCKQKQKEKTEVLDLSPPVSSPSLAQGRWLSQEAPLSNSEVLHSRSLTGQ